MCRASRHQVLWGAVAITLCVTTPGFAAGPPPAAVLRAEAVELAGELWDLVRNASGLANASRQQEPKPRPVPPAGEGGHTVDLNDLSRPTALEHRLRDAVGRRGDPVRLTVPGGVARLGDFSIGSQETLNGHLLVIRGDADVYGKLFGNLVALDGDVIMHPGGVVSGDIVTFGGEVKDKGGEIGGEVRELEATRPQTAVVTLTPLALTLRRLAGVVGVFLTLTILGFALVVFARPNLEIVSDTASHAFGRSLLVGLIGQILLLPTFGMLVVGLILSVVGILLLPFAIAVYALLLVVAVVGGYLAIAHAMGETYVRRRLAAGGNGSSTSYRYVVIGLGPLAALWFGWAVFGWVPLAGVLIWAAAFFVTWLLATAGFGAALLSRAGLRENFAGRIVPPETLTDEFLWATPQFGVPAGRRPGGQTSTRKF